MHSPRPPGRRSPSPARLRGFTPYGPGREGAEATLCAIEGGGHTWPGGFGNVPASIVGEVNRDVSAGDLMWEFFQRHARR